MRSQDISTSIDYGVVQSWRYSKREARDPQKATRQHVIKARVLSMQRYAYEIARFTDEHNPAFRTASKEDRTFGYKVYDGSQYWIARPADIVDLWTTLETRWAAEEVEQARLFAERDKEEKRRAEARAEIDRYRQRMQDTLPALVQQITGRKFNMVLSTSYDYQNNLPYVSATVDARLVERLVECVFEAREAVA